MNIRRFAIVLALFTLFACGPENYQMKQTVEMGPFVFEVTRASEKNDYFSSGKRYKKIYVDLRLYPDKSTVTNVTFDDFLNGEAKGKRMVVFPAMKIKDDHGNVFDGLVNRLSGKRRWRAEFMLIDHRRGIPSRVDYLDLNARDFQLVIKNPDVRKGQPSQVTIKLQ